MSFSGQSGVIAIGPQSAKGVVATTFYRYAATDIDFDAISPGGVLPPEIAGILTPRGAYKMGVFAAGGFSFIPRLDGDLGWILLGLFGEVETIDANLNRVLDWQDYSGQDSDWVYEDSDGWITDPPTPRKLAAVGSVAADTLTTVIITGTAPDNSVVTETLTLTGLTPVTGNRIFKTVTSVGFGVVDADRALIAVGWMDPNKAAVRLYTEGTGASQVFTTLITNPPSPRVLQVSVGAAVQPAGADAISVIVAGTDANGISVTETITCDSAWEAVGLQVFRTVTSVTLDSDLDADEYAAVGYETEDAKEHFFTYAADQETIDWVTIRKVIPGDTKLWMQALDCKLAMARFIVPQAGPIAARIDGVGRVPTFPENPADSDWAYETMDDPDAFPIANATGMFRFTQDFAFNELGVTGMIFEIVNLLTTPQEEMVVGSNFPEDFGVRGRAVTCRFVYRWKNPDLTRQIMTGTVTGEEAWTPSVFTTDLEALVTTPGGMGDDQEDPYRLRFIAPKVEFRQNGPVRLVGNQTIAVEYIGSVLTPEGTGSPLRGGDGEYFAVALRNEEASYVWP